MISLQIVQQTNYTAACRAGTFFAGIGLLSLTVFVNYTQNCVSSGMDVAFLFPKYISQRRGAIIFSILGILAQPWRFLTQASTFITVLSSFGVFMAPAAAILLTDFWLVRKQKWNVPDLYDPHGTYWFFYGVNWRAMAAYFLGMWPALPGFVSEVSGGHIGDGWRRLYQISFFFGFIISGGLFYLFNYAFPPPGTTFNKQSPPVQVDFDINGTIVEVLGSGSVTPVEATDYSKAVEATETKV